MTGRLAGKHIVISGAGSGLGRASALRMAEEGGTIAVLDLSLDAATETVALIEAAGGKAFAVQGNVADDTSMRDGAERVLTELGHVDVVFANAGIPGNGNAHNTSMEQWDRVIGVNLTGVWLTSKYFIPHMQERKSGSIINQASIGGMIGLDGIFPYAAAKGGVIAMTKQMAIAYGPDNIRVNAIAPGTIPTPLVYASREDRDGGPVDQSAADDYAASRFPIRRLGVPEDVANLALFLASDEANWVSGGIYPVDGARTAF